MLILLSQAAPQESTLTADIRWLGPGLIALGCGGLAIVLLLAGLHLVLSGEKTRRIIRRNMPGCPLLTIDEPQIRIENSNGFQEGKPNDKE